MSMNKSEGLLKNTDGGGAINFWHVLLRAMALVVISISVLVLATYAWMVSYNPSLSLGLSTPTEGLGYELRLKVGGEYVEAYHVPVGSLYPSASVPLSFEIRNISGDEEVRLRLTLMSASGKVRVYSEENSSYVMVEEASVSEVFGLKIGENSEKTSFAEIIGSGGLVSEFSAQLPKGEAMELTFSLYMDDDLEGDINRYQACTLSLSGLSLIII